MSDVRLLNCARCGEIVAWPPGREGPPMHRICAQKTGAVIEHEQPEEERPTHPASPPASVAQEEPTVAVANGTQAVRGESAEALPSPVAAKAHRTCVNCYKPVTLGPRCRECAQRQQKCQKCGAAWGSKKHKRECLGRIDTDFIDHNAGPRESLAEVACTCLWADSMPGRGDWHDGSCPQHAHRWILPSVADGAGLWIGRCACGVSKDHRPFGVEDDAHAEAVSSGRINGAKRTAVVVP